MRNRNYPRMGICCGVLSVIFAIILFAGSGINVKDMDTGTYSSYNYYGGDAYTGIQHAAADTSRNVQSLASIVKTGFQNISQSGMGYLLLIIGIWLIAYSLHTLNEMKVRDQYEAQVLSLLKFYGSKAETDIPTDGTETPIEESEAESNYEVEPDTEPEPEETPESEFEEDQQKDP